MLNATFGRIISTFARWTIFISVADWKCWIGNMFSLPTRRIIFSLKVLISVAFIFFLFLSRQKFQEDRDIHYRLDKIKSCSCFAFSNIAPHRRSAVEVCVSGYFTGFPPKRFLHMSVRCRMKLVHSFQFLKEGSMLLQKQTVKCSSLWKLCIQS